MKCSVCGCEETVRIGYISSVDAEQTLEAYGCTKCRHVDFFVPEERMAVINSRLADEGKIRKINRDREEEASRIRKEIDECERIIADENQTVKVVREATERLEELKKKLGDVDSPLNMNGNTIVWKS